MMHVTTDFPAAAHKALADENLQAALARMRQGFVSGRASAVARLPEFDSYRDAAKAVRDHTLAHLDAYLTALAASSASVTGGLR